MANVRGIMNTFTTCFNNRLEPPVKAHLKNVYGSLTMTVATAAAGALFDLYYRFELGSLLSGLGSLLLVFLLMATPHDGKNTLQRLGYLLTFGFLSGMSLGPLLNFAIMVDPAIIVTALTGTAFIFVSFTIAAMLADRGKFLFLGGTLMTFLTTIAVLSLANIFFRSTLLYQVHIYLGLAVMCGFILYDTQLIIEKHRAGSKDFVLHSLDLFVDFIGVFRRLVVILTQKEQDNKRRKQS